MSHESPLLSEVKDVILASPEGSFDPETQNYLLTHGRAACAFAPAAKLDGHKKDWNMGYVELNADTNPIRPNTLAEIKGSGIAADWWEKIRPLINANKVYSTIEINKFTIPQEGMPPWKDRIQQTMSAVIPDYKFEDVPASIVHCKVGPYREKTDRDGYLEFWIALPEDTAKELEGAIQENPSVVRALLGLYFPDVHENLEPALSTDDSVLILDSGWKDSFEMNGGLPVALKEGTVKKFHYQK